MNLSLPNLIGGILFGGIGFVAFVYGKRMEAWATMWLGLILMIYPYFVPNTILTYVIGGVLTVALFVLRG